MALLRPDTWGYGTWNGTGVGTNAGVTVTHTHVAGTTRSACTGVQCSGDAAAVVTVESPAGTILWRKRFAAAFVVSENFQNAPLIGASGSDILVKVSASTTNSEANIQGFDV